MATAPQHAEPSSSVLLSGLPGSQSDLVSLPTNTDVTSTVPNHTPFSLRSHQGTPSSSASSSCTKLPSKHCQRVQFPPISADRHTGLYSNSENQPRSTPRFSRLLAAVLGPASSLSLSASTPSTYRRHLPCDDPDLLMSDISAAQSRTTTRAPSPVTTVDYSMISPPSPASTVFVQRQEYIDDVFNNGAGAATQFAISPARKRKQDTVSRDNSPMRMLPLSKSRSSRNARGLLPRLWDAFSSPGKKNREKTKMQDHNLPLDGEEGELIDDEACFINVSVVPGIGEDCTTSSEVRLSQCLAPDVISLLPPEIGLHLLSFLDLPSIVACLQVSRYWNQLAQDNAIWRGLFYRKSGWQINASAARRRIMRLNSIPKQVEAVRCRKRSSTGTFGAVDSRTSSSFTNVYNGAIQPCSPRCSIGSTSWIGSIEGSTGPDILLGLGTISLNWKELYRIRLQVDKRWIDGEPRMMRIAGHEDSVYCLEFDSQRIVTGSRDKTIKIWSMRTGKLQATLRGHMGSVLCLKFDTKAGFMVSGSSDCTVMVWDLAKVRDRVNSNARRTSNAAEGYGWRGGSVDCGMELVQRVLTGHSGGVLDLRIDENWIVSCSKDALIRVWSRKDLTPYTVLRGHEGPVNAVGLQDGKVVSASGDGKMMLWDILSGERIRTFEGHDRGLACIEYKDDLIVSGSNDCKIKIWSASTGECIRTLTGHDLLVRALSFDPATKRLVSASYDKTVKVWELDTGKMIREFKSSHTSHIFDVKFDACRIVSTSHDQKVVVLDFSHDLDTSLLV